MVHRERLSSWSLDLRTSSLLTRNIFGIRRRQSTAAPSSLSLLSNSASAFETKLKIKLFEPTIMAKSSVSKRKRTPLPTSDIVSEPVPMLNKLQRKEARAAHREQKHLRALRKEERRQLAAQVVASPAASGGEEEEEEIVQAPLAVIVVSPMKS